MANSVKITGPGWLVEAKSPRVVNWSFPSGKLTVYVTNTGNDAAQIFVTLHCLSGDGTRILFLNGGSFSPPGSRTSVLLRGGSGIKASRVEWEVKRTPMP